MEKAHTIHCIVLLFLAVFFFLLYGMKAFFFTSFLFYELPLAILKGQPWGSNRSWRGGRNVTWHVTCLESLGETVMSLAYGDSEGCLGASACGGIHFVGVQCPTGGVSEWKRKVPGPSRKENVSPGNLFSMGLWSIPCGLPGHLLLLVFGVGKCQPDGLLLGKRL